MLFSIAVVIFVLGLVYSVDIGIIEPSPSSRKMAGYCMVIVAKFYGRMPFLLQTWTFCAVQELHVYPTVLGCVLHCLHHE